ncbi:MAG: acyl-CoA thioesterase [Eubacteriales bacterium]|nr:acyl-CoA thioesterase [Eubacteriales bacterium]
MTQSFDSRPCKPVGDSLTTQVHIVMPMHINAAYHLFGGKLMEWIDVVAGVVAKRHSQCEILTAAVDHLSFLGPADLGDTVELVGRVTYVGNTSMEVCVETYVEHIRTKQPRQLVNRAFVTMVALDGDGKPTLVPMLALQNDQERENFEAGKRRREERKRLKL